MDENKTISELASHFEAIIKLIGENPEREGLVKTPLRAAKAFYYATQGYRQNPSEMLEQAIFEDGGSRIVIVKNIEFYNAFNLHLFYSS